MRIVPSASMRMTPSTAVSTTAWSRVSSLRPGVAPSGTVDARDMGPPAFGCACVFGSHSHGERRLVLKRLLQDAGSAPRQSIQKDDMLLILGGMTCADAMCKKMHCP